MAVKRRLVGAAALAVLLGVSVAAASAGPSPGLWLPPADGGLRTVGRGSLPFAVGPVERGVAVVDAAADVVGRLAQNSARGGSSVSAAGFGGPTSFGSSAAGGLADDGLLPVVVVTRVDPERMAQGLEGMKLTQVYRQALYGFAARVTGAQLKALQSMKEVASIEGDRPIQALADSAGVWTGALKARGDFGLTGDGDGWKQRYSTRDAVIAVVDTGVDPQHKDLAGKLLGWKDMIADMADPYDDNGHGTFLAGVAAGAGMVNRSMQGVAPGAALVGVKALDAKGAGTTSTAIAAIEWVLQNRERFNIRIMALAFGADGPSDGADVLSRAVDAAAAAGLLPVVAAGNGGPEDSTIGAPAAAVGALSVCAMRDAGIGGWSLAPFSSRGPTADGRVKPDLCAPGVSMTGPQAGSADRFVTYTGTSAAAGFTAGVAALLLEANPYLTPGDLKGLLTSTAQDWGVAGADDDYGFGRINVYRAVQRLMRMPGLGPSGPKHGTGRGTVDNGAEVWYRLEVADARQPVAITLLLTGTIVEYYDLDLALYDEQGEELAASAEMSRQEAIQYSPVRAGMYYIKVESYEGSGPYALDVSWR